MTKNNEPVVAIFDSGVGGISILRALIKKYNAGNYIYFADNLFMPYGDKKKSFILERVKYIIRHLKSHYHADKIIIACNTASSVIKNDIKEHGGADYEDVITMEFNENLTYLATSQTKKNLPNLSVIADKSLAKQIEDNITNKSALVKIICRHIKKHNLDKMDCFVLGCTHYELVANLFKKLCPNSIVISNSEFILDKLDFDFNSDEKHEINVHFIQTKDSLNYNKKLNFLIDRE